MNNDDSQPSAIIRWLRLDQYEAEKSVTSHFVSSKALFLIRVPLALYSTVVLWVDIGWSIATNEFRHFFAYFTHFTFIGLHAYLLASLYHNVRYLKSRPYHLKPQHAALKYLHVFLYHTVVTFNILTPVVYWLLLSGDLFSKNGVPVMDWWLNISLHGVSFFLMISEVIFARMQMHVRMILPVFSLVLVYMLMTFIIYGSEHWWVYSFLDWSQGPSAAIWYFAVSALVVTCFFLQVGIHALRDRFAAVIVTNQTIEEKTVCGDTLDPKTHQDSRFDSRTLLGEGGLESHITINAPAPSIYKKDDDPVLP